MASLMAPPRSESNQRTKLDPAQMQCIDGLRALAVLIVVIQHYKVVFAGPHGMVAVLTTPGASGVMLFFVISGLCISLSKTDRVSWKQFFIRRAFRLLPALYFSMGLILIANHLLLHDQFRAHNFLGVALAMPHYFPSLLAINAPLWSLQTEVELYLLFPVMLFFFFRTSRRMFIILSAAVTLISYGLWYIMTRQFTYFPPFPAFCHIIVWNLGLLLAYDTFPAQARRFPGSGEAVSRLRRGGFPAQARRFPGSNGFAHSSRYCVGFRIRVSVATEQTPNKRLFLLVFSGWLRLLPPDKMDINRAAQLTPHQSDGSHRQA